MWGIPAQGLSLAGLKSLIDINHRVLYHTLGEEFMTCADPL